MKSTNISHLLPRTFFRKSTRRIRLLLSGLVIIAGVIFFQYYLSVLNPYFAKAYSGNGAGSGTDPYQITTCTQLQEIGSNHTSTFVLMNDIDCSDTKTWNDGLGFDPIGDFAGTFDGRNFSISGLYINRPTDWQAGLFSSLLNGSVVKNVNLTPNGNEGAGPSITGRGNVGAVAGEAQASVLIENAHSNLKIEASPLANESGSAGGLVGLNRGVVMKSSSNGRVTVQANGNTGKFMNLGGLVGIDELSGDSIGIYDSYSTAVVASSAEDSSLLAVKCGGLVGYVNVGRTIRNSYAAGTVSCSQSSAAVGGLVGFIDTGDGTGLPSFQNNFTTAVVTGTNTSAMGGLYGQITNDYDLDLSSNAIDATATGQSKCGQTLNDCAIVNTDGSQANYFTDPGNTPTPLTNWDITGTWEFTDPGTALPTLREFDVMPSAPTGLAISRDGDNFHVSWNAVADSHGRGNGIDDYLIEYRDHGADTWNLYDDGVSTNTEATVAGMTIPGNYDFRVSAHNEAGRGIPTEPLQFATGMPASAPSNITSEVTAKTVTLHWDSVPLATSYRVQMQNAAGDWVSPDVVAYSGTSVKIYQLTPQTTYHFQVVANNVAGDGPWSEPQTVTTSVQHAHTVSTCTELQNMKNDLEGLYTLTQDLNCSATAGWNSGQGFEPVGQYPESFTGTFNGQNHTIANLFMQRSFSSSDTVRAWGAGLFGNATGAVIQNVTLTGATFAARYNYDAGVDTNGNGIPDTNISVPNRIDLVDENSVNQALGETAQSAMEFGLVGVGGVVGLVGGSGTFSNLHVLNSAMSGPLAGGVIGLAIPAVGVGQATGQIDASEKVTMDNLSSSGYINGIVAGGLVGAATSSGGVLTGTPTAGTLTLSNSSSTAGVDANVGGGLLGFGLSLTTILPLGLPNNDPGLQDAITTALSAQGILIQNSAASGAVSTCQAPTGTRVGSIGGLVGTGVGIELQNTTASGDVTVCTASDYDFQPYGGVMGGSAGVLLLSKVSNSTASGDVKTINTTNDAHPAEGTFFAGITGGFAGLFMSTGDPSGHAVISNTTATGNITVEGIQGMINIGGGLIGGFLGSGTIQDSHATGAVRTSSLSQTVVAVRSSGGLVGFGTGVDVPYFLGLVFESPRASTYGLIIDNSYATGAVSSNIDNAGASLDSAGGLAGWLAGRVTVTRSFATGDVSSNFPDDLTLGATNDPSFDKILQNQKNGIANVGGLIGTSAGIDLNQILNTAFHINSTASAQGVVVESSYASGNVRGNISGGLIGAGEFGLTVNKAYATGNVRGTGAAGGLIGETNVVGGSLESAMGIILTSAHTDSDTLLGIHLNSPTLKAVLKSGLAGMGQTQITNTYATGNVTGVPSKLILSVSSQDGPITFKPTSLATMAGGLIGLNANFGGEVSDSYASGDVTVIEPPTLPTERPVNPAIKPPTFPTFAGGLFGLAVVAPQPDWEQLADLPADTPLTRDMLHDRLKSRAEYKNLFSASHLQLPTSTVTGGLVGSVVSPFSSQLGDILPDSDIYSVSNSFYDNSRITYTACNGPVSPDQLVRSIILSTDAPDEQGNNKALQDFDPDQVTSLYTNPAFKSAGCQKVNQNNSQPGYFKNNKSNAPLDSWNFSSIWKVRKDDYPKFVAGVNTDVPNNGGGNPGGTPVAPTLPTEATQTIARLAKPFGRLSIDGGQVKMAWIEAVPILLIRSLPYIIILLLLLLAIRYSYEALRQYRQLKKYHDNLMRVTATKEAVNDFLAITTHHLNTPVAIMSGAVELLQSLQKVSAARISILQTKIKAFGDAISKLATANEVSARASVNREKLIHRQPPNPLKDKAVWLPIVITFSLLATVNVLCMSLRLLNRSPIRLAIEFSLFVLAAALVAFSYRYRQSLEQNKLLAKQELALESSLYKQREQFIPEATAIIADHYESLQVASAPLKGQDYARLFFNGLTMLGGINTALNNLQKFSRFVADPPLYDISHYVQKSATDAKRKASDRNITITTKIAPGLSSRIQPAEINQLVDSLIDNAVKFSNQNGKITIALQRHFSNLQFTVQDNGVGISEAKLATLLKPFVRGTDSMQFNYEGLGLGLYTDSLIVNKLGGNIKISSRSGAGTTVVVSLPLLHEAAQMAPVLVTPEQPTAS